jgi:predicted DNA-binding transcriptional regulator YafY
VKRLELKDIDQDFHDDDDCLEWLKTQRYPSGIECPVCRKITRHHKIAERHCYTCVCGNQWYPTEGTIFFKSSTPLRIWFKVIVKIRNSNNVTGKDIQREFGMTYKTAWRMVKIIKECLGKGNFLITDLDHTAHPSIEVREKTTLNSFVSIEESTSRHQSEKFKLLENRNSKIYSRKRDRTARLLKLQILLSQNPQGLKIDEIGRKCNISKRTIYRDLIALESELGVPVWENNKKRGLSQDYYLPPIKLTLNEAFNIFIAARLLQKHLYDYNPSSIGTFMKLITITPEPLKSQLKNAIDDMEKYVRDDVKIRNINKLIQAWLSHNKVKIRYQDTIFGPEPLELIIDPYFIEPIFTAHSFIIIAYSNENKSIYTFKLAHIIGDIQICAETYEIPSDFNPFDFMNSPIIGNDDTKILDIKLRFKKNRGEVVTKTIWHPSQKVELQADGSFIVQYVIQDTTDFRAWILGFGTDVEVLEPQSYRNQIKDMIDNLHKFYSPNLIG